MNGSQKATLLIPKSEETHRPNKYRPITCLPTTYKLLTGKITDALLEHLTQQGTLEAEQEGCKKGCYGRIDHLLLNKSILKNCKLRQANLSPAMISYKKPLIVSNIHGL